MLSSYKFKHALKTKKYKNIGLTYSEINRQLKIERDLAFALGSISNLEEALKLCLSATIKASGMDSGGIYLTEEDGGLRLFCSTGLSREFVQTVSYYGPDSERAKFIMSSKVRNMYFENYKELSAQLNLSAGELEENLCSISILPIYSGEKVISVINIASHTRHRISPIAKNIMENIAAQMGNIILRIKAEADFRKSEEKYRSIVEQSFDGIVMLKEDGEIIDWNRAMERITGLSREQALGQPAFAVQPKLAYAGNYALENQQNIIERIKSHLELNAQSDTPKILETEICALDGQIRLIQEVKFPIKTGHDQILGCFVRDVTEERRAEKRYKNLLENIPIGISRTLENGQLIMANPFFYKLFGLKGQAESANLHSSDLYACPAERKQILEELKKEKRIANREVEFKKGDGSTFWGELTAGLIPARDNQASYMYSVISDITERKIIQEKLHHTQELFSLAYNYSPQWIGITTLEEGTYLEVNQGFCEMVDYSREEVLGRTPIDLGIWTKEIREKFVQLIRENGEVKNYEAPFKTSKGIIKQGLISTRKISFNGQTCLISIVTDVTELRKLENEISHLDRLYLVGELAASLAHEIRNPLAVVRGFLQLMQIKKEYNFEWLKNKIELMISELDRANTIITEFLTLANGKSLNYQLMDLNSVINSLLPLLEANAIMADKNVNTVLENIPALRVDENEIRQLILNLVRNALEAITPNKAVTIKTFIEGSEVVLAIQDQEPGIDPDILDKLYAPFLTTKDTGVGIGLTICKSIVDRHHAMLVFFSSADGTTACVRFPTPECSQ